VTGFIFSLIIWGFTRDQLGFPAVISDRFDQQRGKMASGQCVVADPIRPVAKFISGVMEQIELFL
jgi:hypothetical protein